MKEIQIICVRCGRASRMKGGVCPRCGEKFEVFPYRRPR